MAMIAAYFWLLANAITLGSVITAVHISVTHAIKYPRYSKERIAIQDKATKVIVQGLKFQAMPVWLGSVIYLAFTKDNKANRNILFWVIMGVWIIIEFPGFAKRFVGIRIFTLQLLWITMVVLIVRMVVG